MPLQHKPKSNASRPATPASDAARDAGVAHGLATSSLLRRFEARTMFDGAAPVTIDLASPLDGAAATATIAEPAQPSSPGAGTAALAAAAPDLAAATGHDAAALAGVQIIFIDSAVSNPATLLAAAPAGAEIVMLDADSDGIHQIASYLAGRSDVAAIHILSHGENAEVSLGNAQLTSETLGAHATDLAAIGSALAEGGDILLYGCDVAGDTKGQDFIAALASLTGADVAASSNDTGTSQLGGNWSLEVQTGSIEAEMLSAPEWNGVLAPLTITTTAPPSVSGATGTNSLTGILEGGVGYSAVWTNAGSIGSTSVDLKATVTSLSASTVSFFTQGDDPSIILNGGATATIRWEIFASGTSQTIVAVGSPNFQIADVDGLAGAPNSREIVRPQLAGLTSYTVDSPTNLVRAESASGVQVSGTQNQNGESSSLVRFSWQEVSTWTVEYTLVGTSGFLNAVFRHDGDGDFIFVAPSTTSLLGIDLDSDNSTTAGTGYQKTFVENGTAVSVVDADFAISQNVVLGTTLDSASIVLTNAQDGDVLLVGGGTAVSGTIDGITYVVSISSGQITVELSGNAPVASYEAAIKAITFSNAGESPSAVNRLIEVSVTNATFGTTSNTALATIQVVPVNDAPAAVNDTFTSSEDLIVTGDLTPGTAGQDSDPDGDTLSVVDADGIAGNGITPVSGPAHGTVILYDDGTFKYYPASNYSGADSFTYRISDGHGGTAEATASIAIQPSNDAPYVSVGTGPAVSGYAAAWWHSSFNAQPSTIGAFTASAANETAGPGLTFSIPGTSARISNVDATSLAGAIANGEYVQYAFTTTANVDPDLFISGFAINNPSSTGKIAVELATHADFSDGRILVDGVAMNTSAYGMFDDRTYLEANTTYYARVYVYSAPGTQIFDDFGLLVSRDNANHATTFTEGDAPIAATNITLSDANDRLEGDLAALTITTGNIVDGAAEIVRIGGLAFALDTSATQPATVGGTTFLIAYDAVSGTFAIANAAGATVVMPQADLDTLIRSVSYENTSEAPTAGDRTLQFKLTDSGGLSSNVATSTITVVPVNDGPIAIDDGPKTVTEDMTLSVAAEAGLLVNDSDVDGGALSVAQFTIANDATAYLPGTTASIAGVGTLVINADGSYTFTPVQDYFGPIPVATYTVSDGKGGTDTATLTLAPIVNVNDAPILDLNSAASAGDADRGTAIAYVERSAPVAVAVPAVADANELGEGDIASLKIVAAGMLDGTNEKVVIAGKSFDLATSATQIASLGDGTFAVIDYDAASGTFSVTNATGGVLPQAGLDALLRGITYQDQGENPTGGVRTLTFTATDTGGLVSGPAVATLSVSPINDLPVAAPDYGRTGEDTNLVVALAASILANDTDAENNAITLTSATNASGQPIVLGSETTLPSGAKLTVNTNGTYTYKPNGAFNHLAAGELGSETFTYSISDGNGGSASATVTITIDGRNDAPQAGALPAVANQDGDSISLDLGAAFHDPDTTDTLTFTVSGLPEGLSFDPATGIVTGTLAHDASQNGIVPTTNGTRYPITVNVSDGTAEIVRTFYLTVTNPAPIAANDALAGTEHQVLTGSVLAANGNDPDHDGGSDSDPLNVVAVNGLAANVGQTLAGTAGGSFTITGPGAYVFDPGSAFDALAQGETRTTSITYQIADGEGGSSAAVVTVTVTGSNDQPLVIDPATGLPAANPNAVIAPLLGVDRLMITPLVVSGYFSDPDASDALIFSIDPATLPPGITFDAATATFAGTPANSASQGGPDANGVYQVLVTGTDPYGAATSTLVVFTFANPVPDARDDALAGTEHDVLIGSVLTDNGQGADADPDGDTLSVVAVNGDPAGVANPIAGTEGGTFRLLAGGRMTFDPGTDFDALAAGEIRSSAVSYTIGDGNGGFDTATLTVTVTGTNDGPIVIDPATGQPAVDPDAIVPPQSGIDGAPIVTVSVADVFRDPDASDDLILSVAPQSVPPGIIFDPATGAFSGTPAHNASQGGPANDGTYAVIVTATDPHGATITTTVVFNFANTAPVALDDALAAKQNQGVTTSVLGTNGNGPDSDADLDPLHVSMVDGSALRVGMPVAGSNGGTFTLAGSGQLAFEPGADFVDLGEDETRTTTISYQISDGDGGVATATVTVTVTGVNDAPLVVDPATGLPPADPASIIPSVNAQDGQPITAIDVKPFFADPDAGDMPQLVYSVDPAVLPAGLSLDPFTGLISGTPGQDASQGGDPLRPGTYLVPITATDPAGATVTTHVTLLIANDPPIAQNDALSGTENQVLAANLIASNGNGADLDGGGDADDLSIASVNGGPENLGQAIDGSNGGTFTIAGDGSATFDPGRDFDDLAQGDVRTTTVNYVLTDGQGGTSTATVTVTATGTNDAPLVIDPATGLPPVGPAHVVPTVNAQDGTAITPVAVRGLFVDPDAGETPQLVITVDPEGLPAGITFDPETATFAGTPGPNASQGGDPLNPGTYVIIVTATDPHGATTTTIVTLVISNDPPVAAPDALAGAENQTLAANVMAGGGNGGDHDGGGDGDTLTIAAVNGDPSLVGSSLAGSNGGSFTIASTGALTFTPGGDFDDLPEGVTRTSTVDYTLSDGQGGTSTTTVTVTVTGTNDAPVIIDPATGLPAADPEHIVPTVVAIDGTPITPFAVRDLFADPDAGETPQLVLAVDALSLPTGITFDPVTGTFSGTPGPNASQGGDPLRPGTYVIAVTATDPYGAEVTTFVTLEIANDPPVAIADALSGTQTQSLAGSVLADNGSGPDLDGGGDGDDLAVVAVNDAAGGVGAPMAGSAGGIFTIASDGSTTFDPGQDFIGLGANETRTTTVAYTIADAQGGTSSATLTVTVTGLNDAPVAVDPGNPSQPGDPATVIPAQNASDGRAIVPLDVSVVFRDPDVGDTLVYSAANLPHGLTIDPQTGIISGAVDPAASVAGPYQVTVTATDTTGAAAAITFVWTVDNPAPIAIADQIDAPEKSAVSGNVFADNGNGPDHDGADDRDTLTVSAVGGDPSAVGQAVPGSTGGTFVIGIGGGLMFDPGEDFVSLGAGESRTTEVSYEISDGQGGQSAASITVTVVGANDAPVVVDSANPSQPGDPAHVVPTQSVADGQTIGPIDVAQVFRDPDATDSLRYAAAGLPPGLGIDPATGLITGTVDHSASVAQPYHVTVTATDEHGSSTTISFDIGVANPPPVALGTTLDGREDTPVEGTVAPLAFDPDGDAIAFSLVTAPGHGTVVLNADGSFTYVPAADFNGTDTFTYAVSDGEGGVATATMTLVVVPVNDAPVVTAPSTAAGDQDGVIPVTGIVIADLDVANPMLTVTVSAEHGAVSVGIVGGMTVTAIPGGHGIVLSGTAVEINASLATLGYQADFGFHGTDLVTVVADDRGNIGEGGPRTGTASVEIVVAEVPRVNVGSLTPAAPAPGGGAPIANLSELDRAPIEEYGGVEITYPNNTYIHFVVTGADHKIDSQYGVGGNSVRLPVVIHQATDPSSDNAGGLIDPLATKTLLHGVGNSVDGGAAAVVAANLRADAEQVPAAIGQLLADFIERPDAAARLQPAWTIRGSESLGGVPVNFASALAAIGREARIDTQKLLEDVAA